MARGATLQDYAELDAIRDSELKNSVLEKIGTSNFKYELKQALDKEKQEDKVKKFIAELEKFATPINNTEGLRQVEYFHPQGNLKVQKPDNADTVKYYFSTSEYGIKLLKEITPEDKEADQEREKKKQKQQENKACLDEISERAFRLRSDFIRDCKNVKTHAKDIMMFAIQTMTKSNWGSFDNNKFLKMFGVKLDKADKTSNELMAETVSRIIAASPERGLLIAAYCNYDDSSGRFYNWECKFTRDEKTINLYSFLEKIGYDISDEERAFCNGTHELFIRDSEDTGSESIEPVPLKAAS